MTTKKYIPFASTVFTTTEKSKPITVNDSGDLISTESIIVNSLKNSAENSKLELNSNEAKFTVAGKTCVINETGIKFNNTALAAASDIPEIVNNLTTDDSTKALSAAMGKALKDAYDNNIEGASGGLVVDGKSVKHSNVVSAKISQGLYKFAYDGNGHITASSDDVIADNLTTDDSGKVLSAKQGKKLEDSKVPFKWTAVEDGCILKVDSTDHILKPVEFKIPFANVTGDVSTNTNLNTALGNKLNKTDIDDSSESSVKLWSSQKVKQITDALTSVATIKVVETVPTPPEENTMYYVGTTTPYSVKLSAGGTVYDMGTTEVDLSDYSKKSDIVNNCTSEEINKPLSAAQGKVLDQKIDSSKTTVENSLTSDSTTNALSAKQGKVLNEKFLPLATGGTVKGDIVLQGCKLDTTTNGGAYIQTDTIVSNKDDMSITIDDSDDFFGMTLLKASTVGRCVAIASNGMTGNTLLVRQNDVSIMDAQGNIDALKGWKALFDIMYPVGSIYMSVTATLPSAFQGVWQKVSDGTFLCSANGSTAVGATGGANSKSLTVANIPSHNHPVTVATFVSSDGHHSHTRGDMNITGKITMREFPGDKVSRGDSDSAIYTTISGNNDHTGHLANKRGGTNIYFNAARNWTGSTSEVRDHTHNVSVNVQVGNTGSGSAFDNRPKFMAVSMWQRIS